MKTSARFQNAKEWPETPWAGRPKWLCNFMARNWADCLGWATWWVPAFVFDALEQDEWNWDAVLATFLVMFVGNGLLMLVVGLNREVFRSECRHNLAARGVSSYR